MEGPEPEKDTGSSVGALEEAHHDTHKHPGLRRMLQLMGTLVPERAAGKWWPWKIRSGLYNKYLLCQVVSVLIHVCKTGITMSSYVVKPEKVWRPVCFYQLEHQQHVLSSFIMWLSRLRALCPCPRGKLSLPIYGKLKRGTIHCTGSWLKRDRSSVGKRDNKATASQTRKSLRGKSQSASGYYLPIYRSSTCLLTSYIFGCFHLQKQAREWCGEVWLGQEESS